MRNPNYAIALDRFSTFGDLLKYLRRCAGMTQRELSIAVGYSDTHISRLEQNERLPDLATVTARFLPALYIDDQREVAERLLELAALVRREDAPAVGLPPYKGLHFFDETDAELFFGRERLTDRLVAHLSDRAGSDERFLAVIGASGSGKSSLVRAGLIPALQWKQPSSGWPVWVVTPTAHPLEALAAGCYQEKHEGIALRKLVEELVSDPESLHRSLKEIAHSAVAGHVILIVDQFEELFTLCRNESEQAAFIENLMRAAYHPGGTAMVVLVLRADFYAHCGRFDSLRKALCQHQEFIGPMTPEELRCAIEEPAKRGHWEFEPGLVELLLHDVGADTGQSPEPGALPLLSHALLTTWQRRRGRKMTLSGYTASGGVRGAIAETAEAVFYDQLGPEQREIARQIFLRLTELGGETSTADTRRRVSFEELVSRPEERSLVQDVLLTLADSRLIITDLSTAEVAHEALIREWPTLRSWLEEDRESLRLHRHLTETAQEWQVLGRDPESLYRGARLAQVVEWAELHPGEVNQLERAFIEASHALLEQENLEREAQRQRELEAAKLLVEAERVRSEEQIRYNQRLRNRSVLLMIALFMVGALAISALIFSQRAVQANHLAKSRELAAGAVSNLEVDPERSVLLALQALQEANTLEARNALHQALPELHILAILPAHQGGAVDVAFSSDGKLLASIGEDGTAKIWQIETHHLLQTLVPEIPSPSSSVMFSPDGSILATAWTTDVILWDASTGERLLNFSGETVGTAIGYNLGVGQISFSPNGERLAVANMEGFPRVWDLRTETEVLTLQGDMQPAKAISFSPDGLLLATGGDEGIVKVWDAVQGAELLSLSLGGIIHGVSFDPDGTRLAAASEDGSVKVWDPISGRELLSLPRQSGLYDIYFLADGNLATAGQDGVARIWDFASGQQILTLAGHSSTIVGIVGSPDGKTIATSGYDGTVRLWDTATGGEVLTIPAHQAIVWGAAYSPDGSVLASASVDGTLKLWDANTGILQRTFSRDASPMDGFTGLAISPDGARVVTGGLDGTITLWNTLTGEVLLTMEGHSNMVVGLAISPDGQHLASASWDGTAAVWDLGTGSKITTFNGHLAGTLITGVAFGNAGNLVFTGGDDNFVRMWDAETGTELKTFSGGDKDIYGVAVHPDGHLLAMGDQDGVITLWDVDSGEKLRSFSGHAGLILRLEFNLDGSLLASASFDRLAKIWDVSTGEEMYSFFGNQSNIFGVSFHPDSAYLATAGADGTVRTFAIHLDDLIALAKTRLTRVLTLQECQKYLHIETCP